MTKYIDEINMMKKKKFCCTVEKVSRNLIGKECRRKTLHCYLCSHYGIMLAYFSCKIKPPTHVGILPYGPRGSAMNDFGR